MAGADVLCVPAEPDGGAGNPGQERGAAPRCGPCAREGHGRDVDAARSLLRKGCTAWLYAGRRPGCAALGQADALIQRLAYRYA